ncbi:MAG: helicase DeaD [Planctomycetota bacterium]|jgi:ATP-dependent RNA helicase DeaD
MSHPPDDAVPASPSPAPAGFAGLGLAPELAATVASLGYEEPTPIQREAIPVLLSGRDLLGQAATGTGKTAAFALPLVQRTKGLELERGKPRGIVLVPTRELAMQVAEALHKYGKALGASVLPIYGGSSFGQQARVLERGVALVVATPGRAVDHLTRGTMDLSQAGVVVLDEADEMLDMGFADDLEAILSRTPPGRQTALFSATLAERILGLAHSHLRDPVRVAIAREKGQGADVQRVRQTAYMVKRPHKLEALSRLLDMEPPVAGIVFCRTRLVVDEVAEALAARGWRTEPLHGGLSQDQRERVLARLREGRIDLLVATDVASRGLDIDHLTHVVNFDLPIDPDAFVHRVGRTGRAGREGVAITLVDPREQRLLRTIQYATRLHIELARMPTAEDLERRRREMTRATVQAAQDKETGAPFRSMAAEMAAAHDPVELLAGALELLHRAEHGELAASDNDYDFALEAPHETRQRREPPGRRETRPREHAEGAPDHDGGVARLFIGAGRMHGLRPGDLVGAITGETGLPSTVIGPIRIAERFSLVEVLGEHASTIIAALRQAKVRGLRLNVRHDREG